MDPRRVERLKRAIERLQRSIADTDAERHRRFDILGYTGPRQEQFTGRVDPKIVERLRQRGYNNEEISLMVVVLALRDILNQVRKDMFMPDEPPSRFTWPPSPYN